MTLAHQLSLLKKTLPKGSSFDYDLTSFELHIRYLAIPLGVRGVGSLFLSKVIELCDENEVMTTLHAKGRGLKHDPTTNDLVKWYEKFGFEVLHEEEEGVFMHRSYQPQNQTPVPNHKAPNHKIDNLFKR